MCVPQGTVGNQEGYSSKRSSLMDSIDILEVVEDTEARDATDEATEGALDGDGDGCGGGRGGRRGFDRTELFIIRTVTELEVIQSQVT